MEKKEKKSDLEQLLNSLIEKGWKPFGEGIHRSNYKSVRIHKNYKSKKPYAIFYTDNHSHWKVLRQVVSKESGLWQFVCENGMRPKRPGYEEHIWQRDGKTNGDRCILENEYQYYLIESALCDEDKLEDFLLNSIKLD